MLDKSEQEVNQKFKKKLDAQEQGLPDGALSANLEDNIKLLDGIFQDVDPMLSRRIKNSENPEAEFCIYYSDGVVNTKLINEDIIRPLLRAEHLTPGPELFTAVQNCVVEGNDVKESAELKEIVEAITYGDTLVLVGGSNRALIINSKMFPLRSPVEPEGEKVLGGPREGFTEGIMTNISLLRRRLRTHNLKMKYKSFGRETATAACICYLDNIVNKKLLAELERRLETIDMDGVLDSNYIAEQIAETSPFGLTTCGFTERPDTAAAKLLEGRIIILVDGTPQALTLPYLLIENFQSNEDYYVNSIYASFSRTLRMIGLIMTVTIPALYIAIGAFHQEVYPAQLMISFASQRQSVPLPAALEAFIMLIIFDILRETGLRMPTSVGQTMSIVGALVIGQAAVEAKLVAAPMIIVVAVTGITSLLLPKMSTTVIIARYFCLLLASLLGMFGLIIGLSCILLHAINLRSFGVPSMILPKSLNLQEVKDTFFRAPWTKMLTRIPLLSNNRTRMRAGGKKW